ncbi:hypothetical protein [Methanococcoides sp. FTZ1]|uniref:hypothetical protein n=1 Tax=Methanococcoides sp. FTZ1 TaxID=3439061 RepID=UPI003F873401
MNQFKEGLEANLSKIGQNIQTPIGHALRMETDFSVKTPLGILKGKAGDYIVKHKSGMVSIIESYAFNKRYEILR